MFKVRAMSSQVRDVEFEALYDVQNLDIGC
jgi:hypothetical protein